MSPRRRLALLPFLLIAFLSAAIASAAGEQATGGGFQATFTGSVSPDALPRRGYAPIALELDAQIRPIEGRRPPLLRRLRIEVNRHARISTVGLPICPIAELRVLSTAGARRHCGDSIVGEGSFSAHIDIPEQTPFPSSGDLLAFYTRYRGHRALVSHVFGTEPARTTVVLPIVIDRRGPGGFGTAFSIRMPEIGNEWGYVTGIDLTISRRYRYRGTERSVISASCPAPPGVSRAPFIAARGTYFLAGGRIVQRLLSETCTAR